jgi:hypothetical protein
MGPFQYGLPTLVIVLALDINRGLAGNEGQSKKYGGNRQQSSELLC